MRKMFVLVTAVLAAVAVAVPPSPVSATTVVGELPRLQFTAPAGVAFCEPAPTGVTGTGNWSPAVTAQSVRRDMTMTLDAFCDHGRLEGVYRFNLAGPSSENCAGGTARFGVTGTGPKALTNFSGTGTFTKVGVEYAIEATVAPASDPDNDYQVLLFVSLDPANGVVGDACGYSSLRLTGHGVVRDV